MKSIQVEIECKDCKGSGVYVGFAERDGIGVVCSRCSGRGSQILSYIPFTIRKERKDVTRVIQANPGIQTGGNLLTFGGMPYKDWFAGKPFPAGAEMRAHTCPAWWCQAAGMDRPDWAECSSAWGAGFPRCGDFCNKAKCWDRYDKEYK